MVDIFLLLDMMPVGPDKQGKLEERLVISKYTGLVVPVESC
jgi:hypothetical protein